MIKTNEEYITSKQALEDVELALLALKNKVYELSPERYQIMSEPYINYINKLRYKINTYLGLSIAEESTIPLWIRLKGPRIEAGNIPINILTSVLNNLRHSVRRVAKYIESETMPIAGRPKEDLRQLCDLKAKFLPGSVRIGLSFPAPTKQITIDEQVLPNPAEEAVKKILSGASWVSGIDTRDIEKIFPKQEERYLILNQIEKITPRSDSKIKSIEFKGKILQEKRVLLSSIHIPKLKTAIIRAIPPEYTTLEGVSREIDLDYHHFRLRERPDNKKPITCMYEETLEEDAIKALNMRVRVMGKLHISKNHLETEKIEVLGPSEE